MAQVENFAPHFTLQRMKIDEKWDVRDGGTDSVQSAWSLTSGSVDVMG